MRIFPPISQRSFLNPAWLCVVAGLVLSLLGVYTIDLGNQINAPQSFAQLSPLAVRQIGHLAVGLLAAFIIAAPDMRIWRVLAWPLLGGSLILLIILLLPFIPASIVSPRNGVRGWIDLGPLDLQPAEFAKIAFVLAAAAYLRFRKNHRTVLGLLPPAIIAFVPMGLIILQPDLGMALLFLPAIFAMLLGAGARIRHMLAILAIGMVLAPASYPFLHDYQKQRILGLIAQFQGGGHASDDINYQSYAAQAVAGSGEITGYNDAKSRAVIKYAALPERHNDMIFAVIVNRFGLLGGVATMGVYLVWIVGAIATAAVSKDAFGRLVVIGLAAIVSAQTVINMGMVLGALPVVGLTLPFVSYGGSSMVAVWVTTGLVLAVALGKSPFLTRESFHFED